MSEIDSVTYPKASEAARALIEDGFKFVSSPPPPPIPGVEVIAYPWYKGSYLSARIVRVRPKCYRIEVVA